MNREPRGTKKTRGVYERIPGSNAWWIRYADAGGVIHKEKIGSFELAVAAYMKRKTEVKEGKLFPGARQARITFGELVKDFRRAKPNHWSGGMLDNVNGWFEHQTAATITPQAIQEKLNSLRSTPDKWHHADKPLAASSINRYRSIIGAVFTWAVRNGRIEKNPVRSIPIRREDNKRIRFLEVAEEKRLRKAVLRIAPDRLPELVLTLNTGIRLGELLSLTWSDVDLKRNIIHLRKTKSGKARAIPLVLNAVRALEELRRYGRETVAAGHPRMWFEPALVAAKIRNFHWHDLRHTFASRLAMEGVSLRDIQEFMGHQSIAMTLRYAHLAPTHLRASINALRRYSGVPGQTQSATGTPTAPRLSTLPAKTA